jgi:hypothetical protein
MELHEREMYKAGVQNAEGISQLSESPAGSRRINQLGDNEGVSYPFRQLYKQKICKER